MCKIKLHKTFKCLWPLYRDEFVVKWMGFFGVFINHFPKIHRNVPCKITIDLLYFKDAHGISLSEKNSSKTNVFIKFHHFKGKKDSNTGLFLWNLSNSHEVVVASENT